MNSDAFTNSTANATVKRPTVGKTSATAAPAAKTAAVAPSAKKPTAKPPAAAQATTTIATAGKGKAGATTSASLPPAATFYYLDFCYPYVEPMNGKTYVSTALDKKRLNAVFRPNGGFRSDGLDVIWLETDPRRFSTTGDGLPDGWKKQYGLDPFDDGVIGDYNLHTGAIITNANNGPNGDPDGDGISNLQEYLNGTNPTVSQTALPPAARLDHHRPRGRQRPGDGWRRHQRQGIHRLDCKRPHCAFLLRRRRPEL